MEKLDSSVAIIVEPGATSAVVVTDHERKYSEEVVAADPRRAHQRAISIR